MQATNLHGKSFLSLFDFSGSELTYLVQLAKDLKLKRKLHHCSNALKGKNIVLVFEKPSTRTRCAFEIAAVEEGGHVTYLDLEGSQFAKKESVCDSAKIFGRYYHAIGYRGFTQQTLHDLATYSQVPVYNCLTDDNHPTQLLADLLTIQEYITNKPLSKTKVTFVGDIRNNVAYSWMVASAKLGIHFVGYGPEQLYPTQEKLAPIFEIAKESGSKIELSSEPACLINSDVIYTDTWVSMGEEAQIEQRVKLLTNYKITQEMLQQTQNPNVLFMHCLPAFHDKNTKFAQDAYLKYGVDICEVDDAVFNSKHSIVFDQAENRLHSIKALLVATLGL